jgi:flagellar hook-associated protein 1 FlgK
MGTGLNSIGMTGLMAAQLGLQTAGHNITNANTAGFNRQGIRQASNPGLLSGAGFVGQGVNVSTIVRSYSEFQAVQINRAQTTVSGLEAYSAQIKQIDNMLADPSAGLSPALQDFFHGVQQTATNPSALPSRQATLSSAQALVATFHNIDDRISQMYVGLNSQLVSAVSSINSYAQQIANLNGQIVIAQSSIGQPANDLLDQRDYLVSELNKQIRATTSTNSDGSYNVYIGSGQQLVVGSIVSTLATTGSAADTSRVAVGLKTASGTQELPESLLGGGALGGLLSFRSLSLDRVANDLGRTAASLALTFNAQNALGQDLQGNIAGDTNFIADFFSIGLPSVTSNKNNTGTVAISATLVAPTFSGNFYTDLTSSDYRLNYDGTNFTLTRLDNNTTMPVIPPALPATSIADINTALALDPQGFVLAESAGAYAAGDSYLIRPARDAASSLSLNTVLASDPRLIAAAAPIRTSTGAANTGGATVSAGSVGTGYAAPAAGSPITLIYSGGNLTGFPATSDVSVTIAGVTTNNAAPVASIAYTSGATITIVGTAPPGGISFEINGTPNNNDSFLISRNTAGVSDGRNALALGKLQTQNTMSGKAASFQSAYAQLVSDVGNKSREVEVTGLAQQTLLTQSESARDSMSGVNLDEEAANMMRYQQAYQASAKILEVGSKMFDTILGLRG